MKKIIIVLPHFGHHLSVWHDRSAQYQEVRGNQWLFLSPSFPCINSVENRSEEKYETTIVTVNTVYM